MHQLNIPRFNAVLVMRVTPDLISRVETITRNANEINRLRRELAEAESTQRRDQIQCDREFEAFVELLELTNTTIQPDMSFPMFCAKFKINPRDGNEERKLAVSKLYTMVKTYFNQEAEDGGVVASSEGSTEPT